MQKKRLIVNADDFGQSEGINRGIIRSHENGIVTSASLMVRYPAAIFAAEYSKKNKIGVGLHIDLGEWVYDNGKLTSLYEVVLLDDVNLVKDEVIKQLEIFYRLVGKSPTHIDSHQHVHQNENIKPLFLEIAERINVTLRGCSKNVNYCGNFYGQMSDSLPYHKAIGVENLNQLISTLPDGTTEMACHPGLDVEIQTMYKVEREIEVTSLCDKSVMETVLNSDIELCSFSGIPF